MKVGGVVLLLVLRMASSARGSDEEAIRAIESEFATAWAAHDPERLASFWTEDGDFMNPFGRFARGRAELEALFAEEHEGVMRESTYSVTLDSLRSITPDVVVTDWTNVIHDMVTPDGDRLPPFTHHVTTDFVKRDGRWWKSAARAMSLLPPPSKEPLR